MSKAQLKKELAHLDRDQLVEVILNAYSSSKEAKEYFEFFISPDAEALLNKKIDIIAKELSRSKRGYSKARISVIRATIKDFAAYGVGDEYVYNLIYNAIRMIVGMERYYYYTDAMNKGVISLTADFIDLADRLECIADASERLNLIVTDDIGRPYFREKVLAAAREAVRNLSKRKH